MKTSDERREVAENLRDIDEAWPTLVDDLEEDPLHFGALAMAGILACVNDHAVFRRLADLIDPTCEDKAVSDDEFRCSSCGYQAWASSDLYYAGSAAYKAYRVPHYCPNCGARVVRAND